MIRRTDRPLGQVRVSFEANRLSPQHLIEAYTVLVPEIRRPRQRVAGQESDQTTAEVTRRMIRRSKR
jgi:hypothetical protein